MGKVEEKSNSKPGTKSDHRIHEEVKQHQNSPVLAVLVFYEEPRFPFP
jgi:hypothetical protein